MASKYSTIPQVLDYLYTQITTAAAGQAQVTVSDGYPGTEQQPDIIAIGGEVLPVTDGMQEAVSLGAYRLEEMYEIGVNLSSYRGGSAADTANDEKVARDAVFALYDLVVGVIAADVSLGNNVLWGLPGKLMVKGTDFETAAMGLIVSLQFQITVKALISLR